MAIRWSLCISLTILSMYRLESSAQAVDTRLEVSFVVNPVPTKSDAVLQCKVWDVSPTDNVGISRYNNNGMNTVLYRNGATLEDISDHISLDVLPDQTDDGAISYTITISEVDSLSDGGLYTCFVLTVDGLVQAIAAANLKVTPTVYPICEASTPDDGDSYFAKSDITLTCTSDMPSVSNVQWVHQDNVSVMEQQISKLSDGKTVQTTVTQTLIESNNGTSFRCILISNDPSKNGSDCVVGPITVLKSNRTSTEITRIAGLPLMVFIIIIVLVVLAFVVCIILLIVCCRVCLLGQRSSNISHSSSKSYSMHGLGNTGDSTLSREGTLPGGREVYNPVRPAPPPPTTPLQTLPSTSDNHGNDTRRLSGIEMALLSAVTHSLGRKKTAKKKPRSDSVTPFTSDTEAIYANTTLGAISEEDHDRSGGGVINPSYEDNNGESFAPLRQPIMPYQPVEYGNLSDLSINVSTDNADYYSTQSDEKPKPLPKPKPKPTIESSARPVPLPQTAFSPSQLRPVAKPKPANKPVPVPKPAIQTPPEPIPRPKPNVNANGMPSKAPPPLPKPSDLSTARPVPPPKPSTGLNDVAPSVPSRPTPPPRPSYDIMDNGPPPPAPPPKPLYQI